MASCGCSFSLRSSPPPQPSRRRRSLPLFAAASATASSPPAVSDDLVLRIAEKLEDSTTATTSSSSSSSALLANLRSTSSLSLLSTPWPTRRSSDSFRFTDLSYLRSLPIIPSPQTPTLTLSADAAAASGGGAFAGTLNDLPAGPARDRVAAALAESARFPERDLFWDFNAVGASDVVVIYAPEGAKMADEPIHLMFRYSGAGGGDEMAMSNPRVLVVAERGAEVAVVEEHFGVDGEEEGEGGGAYWANAVMEVVADEGARVVHSYVQRQSHKAAHTKWTAVRQKASSTYEFVEVSTGARLSRHNLHIQQLGPETVTEMSTFHLSSQSMQIQDLHSRLILDHPRGYSRQLHKCIVCDSGNGVFDGNIRVNRFAQQTDAGQETKCLLLSPQALVNVKPNLQIIADDVKCTHGAAISGELDPNELFYFQARGIDMKAAMDALVFSFGAHVIRRIPFKSVEEKTTAHVKELLTSSRQKAG